MKRILMMVGFVCVCGLLSMTTAAAKGVYQSPTAFVTEAFGTAAPQLKTIWITDELKPTIRQILGRDMATARLRYWGLGHRTAWVLEEIGKEKPITVGVVVGAGKIEQVRVLEYRETRGYEVRYPFFTDQFQGRQLTADLVLDQPIDGISGATLSVGALKKIARLALYLHQQSPYDDGR